MSEKCAPNDPRRCQATTPHGQCLYLALENRPRCQFHDCGRGVSTGNRRKIERYLIENEELRESYDRQQDDLGYLDMRKEIALLTALFERRINSIKNDGDAVSAIGPLMKIAQRLESMKVALLRMQQHLGLVLGKDVLRSLAKNIAHILDEELEGVDQKPELMERISERILESIEEAGEPPTTE